MSSDLFKDVGEFHTKFGLHAVSQSRAGLIVTGTFPPGPAAALFSQEAIDFRTEFLDEELDEFKKGLAEGDAAQVADALVDLVYVALGTAHLFGFPFQQLWDDVQRANLAKERAAADGSNSKRGSSLDVIKPEGWQGPQTGRILATHGFKVPAESFDDPDNYSSTEGLSQ